jgi:hypothetical protein
MPLPRVFDRQQLALHISLNIFQLQFIHERLHGVSDRIIYCGMDQWRVSLDFLTLSPSVNRHSLIRFAR